MRWYFRVLAAAVFVAFIPALSMAQSDLCVQPLPFVPNEAKAEQLRIQAQANLSRELEGRNWEVKMITVKNAIPDRNLNALCIFRIEVVSQPALHLVQVRAPKELMGAIEDAVKRLDVPQPPRKGVELTGYVLVVSEVADVGFMPVPKELEAVESQLKSILPKGNLYLADTMVARGTDGQSVGINRGIGASDIVKLEARLNLREGSVPPVVRLDSLVIEARNVKFETSLDLPVGTQVVVGKGTALRANPRGSAVIIVMTAKLFD